MQRLDHGAIGNGRAIALVAPDSSIEWLCLPRFDSPSIFAALLDPERGGRFRILSGGNAIVGKQRYIPNTNVLVTEFQDGDARWEIVDFLPRIGQGTGRYDSPLEICRIVRPVAGVPRLRIDFCPRPNYARAEGKLLVTQYGVEVLDAGDPVHLFSNVPGDYIVGRAEIPLRETMYFMLVYGPRHRRPIEAEFEHLLTETVLGWQMWSKSCALPSFGGSLALRSALCLKMHAYVDTGAIIAAATTSIPEALGTERCWDYRYCWLRDSAFVIEALRRLSHLNEGEQFITFLRDVAEAGPLQPLYGIAGERILPESVLPQLRGFRGNGPVRIGNAAAVQQQNDLVGEIILCLETVLFDQRIVIDRPRDILPLVRRLVEQAIDLAPRTDTSIWEYRSMPDHYTFSRAMCWAAIDRGAMIAKLVGEAELAERWSAIADREREIVLARGYNTTLQTFTAALDGRHGDASNLLLPSIGLIEARDPRFLATLDDYAKRMTRHGLMYRYTTPDDFGTTTSALTMCSFWWSEALALAGRIEDAIEVFERVVAHANPLGLFSEDIDPETGMLLGNFPQAYTHVGLIHAAMTISTLADARDGRVRAWV